MTKLSLLKIISEENARKMGLNTGSYDFQHSEYQNRGKNKARQEDRKNKGYMQSKSPNKRGYN